MNNVHRFAGPYTLELDAAVETARADVENQIVKIHPLFLISPRDIPFALRVNGPDDPKLQDPVFMEKLKEWVAKKFNIDPYNFKNFNETFQFFLRLWEKKPQTVDLMLEFVINHEMGHIALNHKENPWEKFFTLTLGLTILCLASPFVYAAFAAILTATIAHPIFRAIRQVSERHLELQADKYALDHMKEDGYFAGDALFNCIRAFQNAMWEKKSLSEQIWTFITTPEKVLPLTHPIPKERTIALWNSSLN